jgi:ABC-type nitrate/sulfonate/bicarbonate transport system permease component
MSRLLDRALPGLFFIGLLVAWQLACDIFKVPDFLLPSPLAIIGKIAEIPDRMLMHLLVTLREVVFGFAVATLGGIFLATVTAHSRFLARTLFPMLVVSQTIPTVAIAPLLVIWFGPGDVARLTVVFLIAFFPIVVNTTAGLLRVDAELVDLVRGLNASRWKIFTKIRLPNALPHIFTGMRISIALSVIGAVVAEFVAATAGLGYLVFSGATNMDTKLVFAAVVLLGLMGIILFQLVRLAQSWAVPWAQKVREGEA